MRVILESFGARVSKWPKMADRRAKPSENWDWGGSGGNMYMGWVTFYLVVFKLILWSLLSLNNL